MGTPPGAISPCKSTSSSPLVVSALEQYDPLSIFRLINPFRTNLIYMIAANREPLASSGKFWSSLKGSEQHEWPRQSHPGLIARAKFHKSISALDGRGISISISTYFARCVGLRRRLYWHLWLGTCGEACNSEIVVQ